MTFGTVAKWVWAIGGSFPHDLETIGDREPWCIQLSLYNRFRYLEYPKHFIIATRLCSHCHRSQSFVVLPKTRQIQHPFLTHGIIPQNKLSIAEPLSVFPTFVVWEPPVCMICFLTRFTIQINSLIAHFRPQAKHWFIIARGHPMLADSFWWQTF